MDVIVSAGIRHIKENLFDINNNTAMESNEEIASRLKFLGYIQRDEKINAKYVTRQKNTWTTTLSRFLFFPDNRGNALKFVREVIFRSFDIIEQYIHKGKTLDAQNMILDLLRSQIGLTNLKYTYSTDTKFCCDMDVLLGKIQAKLSLLKSEHSDLFPEEKEEENEM